MVRVGRTVPTEGAVEGITVCVLHVKNVGVGNGVVGHGERGSDVGIETSIERTMADRGRRSGAIKRNRIRTAVTDEDINQRRAQLAAEDH